MDWSWKRIGAGGRRVGPGAVRRGHASSGVVPVDLPTPTDPNFVDAIFDNQAVIGAARVLLVSAAGVLAVGGVFIVASTVVRMRTGDWLKRAGPFEVSETAVAELEGQIDFWRGAALDGQDEISELRELLEASDDLIDQLQVALVGD